MGILGVDEMEPQKFLGRLVEVEDDGYIRIPIDILDTANIRVGSKVEVFSTSSGLFFRNTEEFCDLCGTNGKTTIVGTTKLCPTCFNQIQSRLLRQQTEEE